MKRVRIRPHLYLVILVGLLFVLIMTPGYLKQYWLIFFGFCVVAISMLAFLYARSLRAEAELREWRKQAAIIDPEQIDKATKEGQRQWLVLLYAQGDYQEAAEYALNLSNEVLRFAPCERLADLMRRKNPKLAQRLYQATIEQYRLEGTQATGSGEGLVVMGNIKRVENKLKKIER